MDSPAVFRLRQQMTQLLEQRAATSDPVGRAHIQRTLEEPHNGRWDEQIRQNALAFGIAPSAATVGQPHHITTAPRDPNTQYVETMFAGIMPLAFPSPSEMVPQQMPPAEPRGSIPAARAIGPGTKWLREWGPAPMQNELDPFTSEMKSQNQRLTGLLQRECRQCGHPSRR